MTKAAERDKYREACLLLEHARAQERARGLGQLEQLALADRTDFAALVYERCIHVLVKHSQPSTKVLLKTEVVRAHNAVRPFDPLKPVRVRKSSRDVRLVLAILARHRQLFDRFVPELALDNQERFTNHGMATPGIGAHLVGTDLRGSLLVGVDFSGATLTDISFQAAALSNVSFAGANLKGVSFDQGELSACKFADAYLERSSFDEAVVTLSNFDAARLGCVAFCRTMLSFSRLREVALVDVDFRDARLDHDSFIDGRFTRVQFDEAQLLGLDLRRTSWVECTFRAAAISDIRSDETTHDKLVQTARDPRRWWRWRPSIGQLSYHLAAGHDDEAGTYSNVPASSAPTLPVTLRRGGLELFNLYFVALGTGMILSLTFVLIAHLGVRRAFFYEIPDGILVIGIVSWIAFCLIRVARMRVIVTETHLEVRDLWWSRSIPLSELVMIEYKQEGQMKVGRVTTTTARRRKLWACLPWEIHLALGLPIAQEGVRPFGWHPVGPVVWP